MKTAIIVMSDPKNGLEEALGRVFNALALAAECKQKGDDVAVVFNGTGTRWPAELSKLSHPANGLYNAVRDVVLVVHARHRDDVIFRRELDAAVEAEPDEGDASGRRPRREGHHPLEGVVGEGAIITQELRHRHDVVGRHADAGFAATRVAEDGDTIAELCL